MDSENASILGSTHTSKRFNNPTAVNKTSTQPLFSSASQTNAGDTTNKNKSLFKENYYGTSIFGGAKSNKGESLFKVNKSKSSIFGGGKSDNNESLLKVQKSVFGGVKSNKTNSLFKVDESDTSTFARLKSNQVSTGAPTVFGGECSGSQSTGLFRQFTSNTSNSTTVFESVNPRVSIFRDSSVGNTSLFRVSSDTILSQTSKIVEARLLTMSTSPTTSYIDLTSPSPPITSQSVSSDFASAQKVDFQAPAGMSEFTVPIPPVSKDNSLLQPKALVGGNKSESNTFVSPPVIQRKVASSSSQLETNLIGKVAGSKPVSLFGKKIGEPQGDASIQLSLIKETSISKRRKNPKGQCVKSSKKPEKSTKFYDNFKSNCNNNIPTHKGQHRRSTTRGHNNKVKSMIDKVIENNRTFIYATSWSNHQTKKAKRKTTTEPKTPGSKSSLQKPSTSNTASYSMPPPPTPFTTPGAPPSLHRPATSQSPEQPALMRYTIASMLSTKPIYSHARPFPGPSHSLNPPVSSPDAPTSLNMSTSSPLPETSTSLNMSTSSPGVSHSMNLPLPSSSPPCFMDIPISPSSGPERSPNAAMPMQSPLTLPMSATAPALQARDDNRHLALFFAGLLPYLDDLTEDECLEFQSDVICDLRKIKKARSCSRT